MLVIGVHVYVELAESILFAGLTLPVLCISSKIQEHGSRNCFSSAALLPKKIELASSSISFRTVRLANLLVSKARLEYSEFR
jgi:hypothetical protein